MDKKIITGTSNTAKIKEWFFVNDPYSGSHIKALLENWDWDYTKFGKVLLVNGNLELELKYFAHGNINNVLVVCLQTFDGAAPRISKDLCENARIFRICD